MRAASFRGYMEALTLTAGQDEGDGRALSLADIAQQCSLSVSHFARGFRQARACRPIAGWCSNESRPPKPMLLARDLPIAQIAQECGFADQSSFTKAFLHGVGTAPAAWRRARQS